MAGSGKPWYRARNVAIALALAVCAWVGVRVYSALTATPGQAINYGQMAVELTEANQPAGTGPGDPNAWVMVVEAAEALGAIERDARDAALGGVPVDYTLVYSPITEKKSQEYYKESLESILQRTIGAIKSAREQGILDTLDEAARLPRAVRPGPQQGPMIGWLLPELGRMRNFARLNAARMKMATDAGDGPELLAAYEANLALARMARAQTWLIDVLVGIAIEALAHSHLSYSMVERQWDEATLRGCLEALDRQRAWHPPKERLFEGERIVCMDFIQWTHTDDGKGDGRLILTAYQSLAGGWGGGLVGGGSTWLDELMKYRIINIAGLGFASKKASVRKANEFYDGAAAMAKLPRWQRGEESFNGDVFVEGLSPRYAVLKIVLPAVFKGLSSADQIEVTAQATRLQILLELYRIRHGEYPERLEGLVPEFVAALPMDSYNGKGFGYRRVSNDPHGRGYLLYTFGEDGEDNGGTMGSEGNSFLAFQARGAGLDFVFNQPRELPEDDEDEEDEAPAPGEAQEGAPAAVPEVTGGNSSGG
jgi:hypothetical protein